MLPVGSFASRAVILSIYLSPLLHFFLVLLIFLSCLFSANGLFSCPLPPPPPHTHPTPLPKKILPYFLLRDSLFICLFVCYLALGEPYRGHGWSAVCTTCCRVRRCWYVPFCLTCPLVSEQFAAWRRSQYLMFVERGVRLTLHCHHQNESVFIKMVGDILPLHPHHPQPSLSSLPLSLCLSLSLSLFLHPSPVTSLFSHPPSLPRDLSPPLSPHSLCLPLSTMFGIHTSLFG